MLGCQTEEVPCRASRRVVLCHGHGCDGLCAKRLVAGKSERLVSREWVSRAARGSQLTWKMLAATLAARLGGCGEGRCRRR